LDVRRIAEERKLRPRETEGIHRLGMPCFETGLILPHTSLSEARVDRLMPLSHARNSSGSLCVPSDPLRSVFGLVRA
jgi:hypothetical protein